MQSIISAPPFINLTPSNAPAQQQPDNPTALLRHLLELQREHLAVAKAQLATSDEKRRWQQFHGRWAEQFPALPAACKEILPRLERQYLEMIQELTEKLADEDLDPMDADYALGEFLDRYSVRISQLGSLLGPIHNLANVVPPPADS